MPRQAALRECASCSGVVAMSIVLMAVFLPVAFFPGATDRYINSLVSQSPFHRDLYFALTRSFPLALLLRRNQRDNVEDAACSSVARSTGFDRFNWALTKCARGAIAQLPVRIRVIVLAVFVALLC